MKRIIFQLVSVSYLLTVLLACSGVEPVNNEKSKVKSKVQKQFIGPAEHLLEPKRLIEDKKEFPNGIKIQWFKKGKGDALNSGDVIELNFKVKLTNGTVVDGNHLLKREMIPYMVGYGMQTKGWDIAMNELHVGDFVEIYLPGYLARGKKGIKGLIPPNAANIIFVRIGEKIKPTRVVNGVKVWELQRSPDEKLPIISESSNVGMDYFAGTKSNPKYDNSYQRNAPYRFNMKDNSLLPGLKFALKGAKLYDKLWILVPSELAFGKKGYLNIIQPNESIFYDVFISEVPS